MNNKCVISGLEGLDACVIKFIRGSKSRNTWKKYDPAALDFEEWCQQLGFQSKPADVKSVLRYLAGLATSSESVGCVSTAASAIAALHKTAGFSSPTADFRVSALMEGVRRAFTKPAEQKDPLTVKILEKMVILRLGFGFWRGSIKDWRSCWLANLLFRACARFHDSVSLKKDDFIFQDGRLRIFFRYRKNDQRGAGHSVIVFPSDSEFCFVRFTRRYFDLLRSHGDFGGSSYVIPKLIKRGNSFKYFPDIPATDSSCRLALRNDFKTLWSSFWENWWCSSPCQHRYRLAFYQ